MAQVAAAVGVTSPFVSAIEAETAPLPSKHTEAWARLLGVAADELRQYEAVEVSLAGLARSERAKVAAFVAELKASRAA